MEMISTLIIALALAMDSFSVALSGWATMMKHIKFWDALKIGLYFWFFQGILFLLGWFGWESFSTYIESFDHWVAFTLLAFIGGKMLFEAFSWDEEKYFIMTHKVLLTLAFATSIDAFWVGMSYALLWKEVFIPSIIIAIVAFICSFAWLYLGKILKNHINNYAEILGGVVLIGIGFKILYDHGVFLNIAVFF